jgi:hypothetical protein
LLNFLIVSPNFAAQKIGENTLLHENLVKNIISKKKVVFTHGSFFANLNPGFARLLAEKPPIFK